MAKTQGKELRSLHTSLHRLDDDSRAAPKATRRARAGRAAAWACVAQGVA